MLFDKAKVDMGSIVIEGCKLPGYQHYSYQPVKAVKVGHWLVDESSRPSDPFKDKTWKYLADEGYEIPHRHDQADCVNELCYNPAYCTVESGRYNKSMRKPHQNLSMICTCDFFRSMYRKRVS